VNVRRDGRVALLFSDPTGSGHSNPAQIFIRGIAECPPELTTSPAALEEFWSMLFWRQPSSRGRPSWPSPGSGPSGQAWPVPENWLATGLPCSRRARLTVASRWPGWCHCPWTVRGRITASAAAGEWLFTALARHPADRGQG